MYFSQTYVFRTQLKWLGDDKHEARLIQYLRDPSRNGSAVALLVDVWQSDAFRHRAEARAEALAISNDDNAPLGTRMAALSLLLYVGDDAAGPLIETVLADAVSLNKDHANFENDIEFILNALVDRPHPRYVAGLEHLEKVIVIDGPITALIETCRNARSI
jgi:hypothetical protein